MTEGSGISSSAAFLRPTCSPASFCDLSSNVLRSHTEPTCVIVRSVKSALGADDGRLSPHPTDRRNPSECPHRIARTDGSAATWNKNNVFRGRASLWRRCHHSSRAYQSAKKRVLLVSAPSAMLARSNRLARLTFLQCFRKVRLRIEGPYGGRLCKVTSPSRSFIVVRRVQDLLVGRPFSFSEAFVRRLLLYLEIVIRLGWDEFGAVGMACRVFILHSIAAAAATALACSLQSADIRQNRLKEFADGKAQSPRVCLLPSAHSRGVLCEIEVLEGVHGKNRMSSRIGRKVGRLYCMDGDSERTSYATKVSRGHSTTEIPLALEFGLESPGTSSLSCQVGSITTLPSLKRLNQPCYPARTRMVAQSTPASSMVRRAGGGGFRCTLCNPLSFPVGSRPT